MHPFQTGGYIRFLIVRVRTALHYGLRARESGRADDTPSALFKKVPGQRCGVNDSPPTSMPDTFSSPSQRAYIQHIPVVAIPKLTYNKQ